jgi:peptidoglycan/LPS O-acetylase OafA/YrhL
MGVLRVLLALSVVIAHSQAVLGTRLVGGVIAVQMFFIISGFYMTLILSRKYVGPGSYSLFLSNRFLRLFPVYWLVLVITLVVGGATQALFHKGPWLAAYVQYHDNLAASAWLTLIVTSIALFGQDLIMFLGLNLATGQLYWTPDFSQSDPPLWHFLPVGQAWTLGIELTFYLMAPFLVRRSPLVLLCVVAASLGLRLFLYVGLGLHYDPWTYRFFPTELAFFLMGALSYKYYEKYLLADVNRLLAISMAGSVLGFVLFRLAPWFPLSGEKSMWLFYGWFCLALPYIFALTHKSALDARIGELSYPVYVVHLLVLPVIWPLAHLLGLDLLQGELAVAGSLTAAFVLVKLVTDPLESYRQSRVGSVSLP